MSVRSLDRLRQLANRPTPGPAAERILDVGGAAATGFKLYKATADEDEGEITVKWTQSDGTFKDGEKEITLAVLP